MTQLAANNIGLFAQLTLAPLWHDSGLPLAFMGMLVVFVALCLVAGFIAALPRLMTLLEGQPRPVPPTSASASAKQTAEEIPEEVLVVLAAAAAAALGDGHRIIHVSEAPVRDRAWTMQGRAKHHSSHRPH